MLILLSCSDVIENTQGEVDETLLLPSTTTSSTTTTIREITTEESSSDYLDEAFSPGYSPNELFYEQDTKSRYFPLTRNKLIDEKIIDEGIELTTEYKNTVIFWG